MNGGMAGCVLAAEGVWGQRPRLCGCGSETGGRGTCDTV